MKKILSVLALVTAVMLLPAAAGAVTPEELEQARTYAAIIYLRNANNGADYLDKVSAGSLKALEGKLKDKEKENLRLFRSKLPSSSGSDTWGMKELVEYAQKAVKAPGNYSSTGYAAQQVTKRVRGMKLAPTRQKTEEAAVPAPTLPAEEPAAEQKTEEPVADTLPAANMPDPFAQGTTEAAADSALTAAEDSLLNQLPGQQQQEGGNSSAIYIIILCVLVVLVVVLVIYAARYFNRQGGDPHRRPACGDRDVDDMSAATETPAAIRRRTAGSDDDDMRDRTIESLRAENTELRRAIEEYKYHLNYLKAEKEKSDSRQIQTEARAATVASTATAAAPAAVARTTVNDTFSGRRQTVADTPQGDDRPDNRRQRVIYLGRANRERMFIRAERSLNPQHSLFRLVTSDNVTGAYTVAEDAEVEDRILANPEMLLAVSCQVKDNDTYGKEAVVTEEPGTAVFENGRWRVLRPAKVKFV